MLVGSGARHGGIGCTQQPCCCADLCSFAHSHASAGHIPAQPKGSVQRHVQRTASQLCMRHGREAGKRLCVRLWVEAPGAALSCLLPVGGHERLRLPRKQLAAGSVQAGRVAAAEAHARPGDDAAPLHLQAAEVECQSEIARPGPADSELAHLLCQVVGSRNPDEADQHVLTKLQGSRVPPPPPEAVSMCADHALGLQDIVWRDEARSQQPADQDWELHSTPVSIFCQKRAERTAHTPRWRH